MDGFPVDDIRLEDSTPLSSQRIKELTMKKINHTPKRRILPRILLVAAVIAALTTTAFAADVIFNAGDVLRDVLNAKLVENQDYAEENELDIAIRETISEGQIGVVNELGQGFVPITKTSEGTTMTLAAAYGDEHVLYLYLQVIAPEGTILPDDVDYRFYDPTVVDYEGEDSWLPLQVPKGEAYKLVYGIQFDIQALPDDAPGDNKKDFYITITAQDKQKARFNDGIKKFFNIAGIYQQVPDVDGDMDGYYLIAPGNFSFDVGIVNEVEKIELDVKGLNYGGHKTRSWTHDSECKSACDEKLTGEKDPETGLPIHAESWDYSVTVKKLVLSPLSAEWEVEYTSTDPAQQMGIEFCVMMKDGTSPLAFPTARSWRKNKTMGVVRFETPVDFAEIDYILIGDPEINSTHKVYLP